MGMHDWLPKLPLWFTDKGVFRRACKGFWSKRKIPVYVGLVLAAFLLTAISGPGVGNAIQVAALTILVIITAEYAASTKRMVDEAKRSRRSLSYRYEKQEQDRARALFTSLLEETRSNLQVWDYYKDLESPDEARGHSLVRFRVSGKDRLGSVDAIWLSRSDTLPNLREAYFAMQCFNSEMDAYYRALPFKLPPGTLGEEYTLSCFVSEVRRMREGKFGLKDHTFASLLQEVIQEIERDEREHFEAIRQAKAQYELEEERES